MTMHNMYILLIILLVIVCHKAIILATVFFPFAILSIPRVYERKNLLKPFLVKVLSRLDYICSSFKYRLCLKWVSAIPSHHIRNLFYRYAYAMQIGDDVTIYYGCELRAPANITIGKGSIIGDCAILDGRAGITIGENVNFSSYVSIWTMQHDYRDPRFQCTPEHYGPVEIKDRAWIGPNVIILHDVTIGEGAVIGAGAVVTKDIPAYCLAAGVPAKVIGERPRNLSYTFNGSHAHFL